MDRNFDAALRPLPRLILTTTVLYAGGMTHPPMVCDQGKHFTLVVGCHSETTVEQLSHIKNSRYTLGTVVTHLVTRARTLELNVRTVNHRCTYETHV